MKLSALELLQLPLRAYLSHVIVKGEYQNNDHQITSHLMKIKSRKMGIE